MLHIWSGPSWIQLIQSMNSGTDCHCFVYMRPYHLSLNQVSSELLSRILGCPVFWFTCIRRKPSISLKVKIPKSGLYTALSLNATSPHCVRLWFPRGTTNSCSLPPTTNIMERKSTTSPFQFNIVTWNCRGFNNSVPYLNFLLNLNNSIVVLQEHWLWPFELANLQTVSEKIDYHAVSDPRLNETSELTRGCGGVAILWNKDLHVEKIPYPGNGIGFVAPRFN